MLKTYLSYRQDILKHPTLQALKEHLGEENTANDLKNADQILVIIDRDWENTPDLKDGNSRLRREIESSITNINQTVHPVLLDERPLPKRHSLPPTLEPLFHQDAIRLNDSQNQADDLKWLDAMLQHEALGTRGLSLTMVIALAILAFIVLAGISLTVFW